MSASRMSSSQPGACPLTASNMWSNTQCMLGGTWQHHLFIQALSGGHVRDEVTVGLSDGFEQPLVAGQPSFTSGGGDGAVAADEFHSGSASRSDGV